MLYRVELAGDIRGRTNVELVDQRQVMQLLEMMAKFGGSVRVRRLGCNSFADPHFVPINGDPSWRRDVGMNLRLTEEYPVEFYNETRPPYLSKRQEY